MKLLSGDVFKQKLVKNKQNKVLSALEADKMLKRANELANIANKTTDREQFYNSICEIKSILRELAKHEGKLPFIGSPSSDLINLEQSEQKQIELLEKRIEEYKNEQKKFSTYSETTSFDYDNPAIFDSKEIDYGLLHDLNFDEYFIEAGRFIIDKDKASIGIIQRIFKIGFNRSARIMDQLEAFGVVEKEEGTKPRKVLMSKDEFEKIINETFNPINIKVEKAERLEHIVNTTIDEKEFATSLNELTQILYDLIPHEEEISKISPKSELERISQNRSTYFDKFYKRRKESNSIEKTDGMTGQEFEEFCAKILEKNKFKNIEVTKGSGDHGADILAEKDDITYAIQCKCYSSDIGNAAVQQAHTGKSIYKKDIAVVLTNRYFTSQAREEAAVLGVKLWDRDKLNGMIQTL